MVLEALPALTRQPPGHVRGNLVPVILAPLFHRRDQAPVLFLRPGRLEARSRHAPRSCDPVVKPRLKRGREGFVGGWISRKTGSYVIETWRLPQLHPSTLSKWCFILLVFGNTALLFRNTGKRLRKNGIWIQVPPKDVKVYAPLYQVYHSSTFLFAAGQLSYFVTLLTKSRRRHRESAQPAARTPYRSEKRGVQSQDGKVD